MAFGLRGRPRQLFRIGQPYAALLCAGQGGQIAATAEAPDLIGRPD